ncbi:ABC transporter ATP-binding protein [Microbacterium esteraromaticum]|uniref:dipeptide ABC transporter ATP-binding protein n=1 Tax=Microbacterium esteraromaticum TaxID=57043 RepID=UPI00236882CF|nr:ABC transporter ATP-binding protein [Microbacterium esteraromaticum]WDH78451.1 ABC transporter ATP-binding protein [Microbacterium esteraromaticum]
MSGVEIVALTVTGHNGTAVQPIDAVIEPGRTLAIIGESGSGKTLTAKSLVGLLPRGFRAEGTVRIGDRHVSLDAAQQQWRSVRGGTVTLLLQDPFTSLSPVHTCGDQIGWTLDAVAGRRLPRAERERIVAERLAEVKLPEHVARAFPHQLSGGMRQRVAIAAALAASPQLIIADEPTTALDASNQAEILDLLRAVQRSRNLCVILISHDLGLVRGRTDDVLVMRQGEVVERGATATVLADPQHPYTRALIDADPSMSAAASAPAPTARADGGEPLLRATDVVKHFGDRRVLDGVGIEIAPGQIVGVVGESGSGKSTFARCIAGLETEDSGSIVFDGAPLAPGRRSRTPDQMQIVFQDPYSSLNPMMTIGQILREALRVAGRAPTEVGALLQTVGLPADFARKRPAELSGGQRQRIAIARALAPRPRLLICDESVSALDVSVQAQILALLRSLRDDLGIAILFISHDLAVVRMLADTATVLWAGRVVESGPCAQVLTEPRHEYTRLLVAAATQENTASTPMKKD